jgi:hypothetical protein
MAIGLVVFTAVYWVANSVIRAREAGVREQCRTHLHNFALSNELPELRLPQTLGRGTIFWT